MTITYCCNPICPKPHNPPGMTFCQNCGQRLRLGDRYGAFNGLGTGVSSRTYLGLDLRNPFDSRCIIKGFVYGDSSAEAEMEEFRREVVQLDAVSQHPQLPNLFAYFERGRQQYLVQEFVDGHNLAQQLAEAGTLSETQLWELLRQVLPVLQFLHDRQIIHRDIKPTNLIRRSGDQTLMVVDFGAAKHATRSALMETGTTLGSAEYTAPEQLMGKAIFASDLYSLGVTCIHLLTGLRPFDLFHTQTSTWFWRGAAGAVSDRLAQTLDRLIQNDASRRYGSAAEVMKHLGMAASFASTPSGEKPRSSSRDTTAIWGCVQTWETGAPVNAIALHADGQRLMCGGNDGTIAVWNVATGTKQEAWHAYPHAIASLAMTPDGRVLLSGGRDDCLRLWEPDSHRLVHTLAHRGMVSCLALSHDSTHGFSGSHDRTIRQWDLITAKLLHCFEAHKAPVEAIALSPTAEWLVSGDAKGVIHVWHVGTRELLRTLTGHSALVQAIAFAPDDTLITGSWDMTIKLRNVHTGGIRRSLSGHLLPITSVAIDPVSQTIATGSHDTTIKLWSLTTGELRATLFGHIAPVEGVVFHPTQGQLISGGQDGSLRQWQRID
ncbi:MAG: protein kinase [Leptolyngbyaceae cyanobacterium SL_7_1]|nr:protein kinase [Leptolyngbyaceae cyanobacterium SL_7_1]